MRQSRQFVGVNGLQELQWIGMLEMIVFRTSCVSTRRSLHRFQVPPGDRIGAVRRCHPRQAIRVVKDEYPANNHSFDRPATIGIWSTLIPISQLRSTMKTSLQSQCQSMPLGGHFARVATILISRVRVVDG